MGYTRGRRGDASQGRDGPVEVGADSDPAPGTGLGEGPGGRSAALRTSSLSAAHFGGLSDFAC